MNQDKFYEEQEALVFGGMPTLITGLAILIATTGWVVQDFTNPFPVAGLTILVQALLAATGLFLVGGLNTIQPNEALVLTLFGTYNGTVKNSGFFWINPFCSSQEVSLRVNNFTTETIKVNDKNGNPIEIAAVISWKVASNKVARSIFGVADATKFIKTACESAIREVASSRVYDHSQDEGEEGKTLRGDLDGVTDDLIKQIGHHVDIAGIDVISAKITHLAYAPEIAMAMLRKQQAQAMVAARKQIVEGAIGMVEQTITKLNTLGIVELSPSEKATLVTSLLTVLVSETETQPVLTLNKS